MKVFLAALRGIAVAAIVVGLPAYYVAAHHSGDIASWVQRTFG